MFVPLQVKALEEHLANFRIDWCVDKDKVIWLSIFYGMITND